MDKPPNIAVLLWEMSQAFANCMAIFNNMSSSTMVILSMVNIYYIVQRKYTKLGFLCLFLTCITRFL